MLIAALSNPERHLAGFVLLLDRKRRGFRSNGRVGNGGHPSSFNSMAINVERGDATADRHGQPMPSAVSQPEIERFGPRRSQVIVVQPNLILAARALQF